MNCRSFLRSTCWLLLAAWPAIAPQIGQSSDVRRLSGSYEVVQKTEAGPQNRVQLRLRLSNHRSEDLRIQRIALWDFSHPARESMRACFLLIHGGSSADTTQEFTLPRSEYESWRHGKGPRLLLEVLLPSGRTTTAAVELSATSSGKAN
jgi:hypothetical protein